MADEFAVLMFVPEIEGSATLVGTDPGQDGSHEGWIPALSCSFGLERKATAVDSTSKDESEGVAPETEIEPISVKRRADGSTAELLMWLANKDEDQRRREPVLIDFCSSSGRYFLRYELKGAELVGCSVGFTAPDDLSETLTFTYTDITIFQRPIDMSGEVLVEKETKTEYHVRKEE